MIFTRQCKGAGEEVTFGCLHAANIPFKIFPVSLEVFHHEVFASKLKYKTQKPTSYCICMIV